MQTENLKPSLPPYHFSQLIRCVIRSAATQIDDFPGSIHYLVDVPGDRRPGLLSSENADLQIGNEVDGIFISYFGRTLQLQEFREGSIMQTPSDKDMKAMSLPIQGCLVSVEVSGRSGDQYTAVYKDYWGNAIEGSLISSRRLECGEILEAAVSGWNSADMGFVSVEDVEKEIGRQTERSDFLLPKNNDCAKKAIDFELEWMGAVTQLTHKDTDGGIFQPMIDEAEVLIGKIQRDGLKEHWNETVNALKMYAFPNEVPEISEMLQQFVEKYSEKEVIEFLSFRLHPDKECPLTPISREILQTLSATFRAKHPNI